MGREQENYCPYFNISKAQSQYTNLVIRYSGQEPRLRRF